MPTHLSLPAPPRTHNEAEVETLEMPINANRRRRRRSTAKGNATCKERLVSFFRTYITTPIGHFFRAYCSVHGPI
ncbi:hypothetical protein [Absidia glauca]|uniref:Uncharacterized protein n=1 Tax=Absidia glauca TaxID=4829 RepID=A0A168LMM7_ABSGL|nr:hypothetical protein [Absidia glauca]